LGIYWKSSIRGLPFWLAVIASLFSVFTVSSAAILALVIIFGALFYDWLTENVRQLSWPLLLFGVAVGLMLISLTTNSGIVSLLIRFVTLDPGTGYFRVAIWQFGTASVWAHPLFGIGFDSYDRPEWMLSSSVDAHWLLYAMRYGLPASVSLLLACIFAVSGLVRAEAMANRRDAGFYRGIMISLITLVIMAFTVALQGGTLTWFSILLGGCVACSQHTYVIDWAFWRKPAPPSVGVARTGTPVTPGSTAPAG
jgi:O-antigen ligase